MLHKGPMKCTGWDTRPSRVMPYNGFMCSMLATNNLFLRVQLKASLLISWCYLTKVCSKPSVCCGRVSGTPLWGSESPKFLLGWWRFNIQTFWGYPHWSIPQGYQKEFWYPFWITKPVPKLREMRGLTRVLATRVLALERATSSTTLLVVLTMQLGEGSIHYSSTVT